MTRREAARLRSTGPVPRHVPERPVVVLRGSLGISSTRSEMMWRWISSVPPAIDPPGTEIRISAISPSIGPSAPQYGSPVEWHQDWAYYPHTNDDLAAVGIMVDDVDLDNGPMLVLPRSHKGPIHDHHTAGRFCGAIDVGRSHLEVATAVPCLGRAGTITV